MEQNNWFRMMGISNAFSLSAASLHRTRTDHTEFIFGRLFQSCLVFCCRFFGCMWRKREKNPLIFFWLVFADEKSEKEREKADRMKFQWFE